MPPVRGQFSCLEGWLNPEEARADLAIRVSRLARTIGYAHRQFADDICWLDFVEIFKSCGLAEPDRTVGDKQAMLENCRRFIDTYCRAGTWRSYAELEAARAAASQSAMELYDLLSTAIGHIRRCPADSNSLKLVEQAEQTVFRVLDAKVF